MTTNRSHERAHWFGSRRRGRLSLTVTLCLVTALAAAVPQGSPSGSAATGCYTGQVSEIAPPPAGKTPLMDAAGRGDTATVRKLIGYGADVNAANRNGGTALMYAAAAGRMAALAMLLDHGARVDARSRTGWTALTLAAVKGHPDVVQRLLRAGADINAADVYGWTPLMRAVHEQRHGAVQVLLDAPGVDVDARNEHGSTALHLAAQRGDRPIVEHLLAGGANPELEDQEGLTPSEIASMTGHPDLASFLAPRRGELP